MKNKKMIIKKTLGTVRFPGFFCSIKYAKIKSIFKNLGKEENIYNI